MSVTSKPSIRDKQYPAIRQLADCIESTWQKYLQLEPYNLPSELGYVEGKLEGEKLTIENRCYQTREFRKLHLELAKVGELLDILHCVMFPRQEFALPMFGTDLVGGRGQISAAIVDLSPITPDFSLPDSYRQALSALPAATFSQPRDLPGWGDIFSEFCLFIRPTNLGEEQLFISRVQAFLEVHCQEAIAAQPVSLEEKALVVAGQQYYCTKQQQNDKTRRVLEKAFGNDWAEHYMNNVLFDFVKKDEV
ncbi:phycocyanobilin:ferredoxin oxidoreductase [Merismopedia glauca]|uniref:Phycocyanobilin:ferredoxin oxidoreductase n=1 Tax=Merismopedia glauca CCAP 1448/3 TaxID=1296344 RepID=A0A2T1C3V9_9CYAN|nr:phycocyanobilin:ferredoxin oxidoreductase [Merismopedia glauca]PSB02965.1 phycocyanobilin:ferredoxin oxidoreductase [Merismopedia glauca CCAP 1448/3]